MKIISFKSARIFIRYSRTLGYESWVRFKNPQTKEEITVCLESRGTVDGVDEISGFATYKEALEAAKETIETVLLIELRPCGPETR